MSGRFPLRGFWWACWLVPVANAATFYVAPTGGGTNSPSAGTSPANPFATVAYAAGRVAPGDEIVLLPGTYRNPTYGQTPLDIWKLEETVRVNNLNGTAAAWITIRAQTPGTVLMQGDGDAIFQLRNSSYVRVSGLTIEGEVDRIPVVLAKQYQFAYKDADGVVRYRVDPSLTDEQIAALTNLPVLDFAQRPSYFSTTGLLVQNSHHVEITDCTVHHLPGAGVRLQGIDHTKALRNTVHDCSRRSAVGTHGFVVQGGTNLLNDGFTGTRIELSANTVYDNYNEIYSWSELKTFINPQIDEGKGLTVQKTTAAISGWNIGRILIANNVCDGNGFSGIHLNGAQRVDIVNNTCFNNQRSGSGPNTGISVQDGADVTVRNNITVAVNDFGGRALSAGSTTGLVVENNVVQGTVTPEISAVAVATVSGDPRFVDASARVYRLRPDSPAIGLALPAYAPSVDHDGAARTPPPDAGALEFIPSALQLWRLQYFGTMVNAGTAADGSDANGSGTANLADFACGLPPVGAAILPAAFDAAAGTIQRPGMPSVFPASAADGGRRVMYFTRRKDRAALGLSYTLEAGMDLQAWHPVPESAAPGPSEAKLAVVAADANHEIVKALLPDTTAEGAARFFRVKIGNPSGE
ncbi:right-handed parallel beta-helix repeat-containing protein [Luteolibacter ambystomatis]|uniref:Right-handed parallel beta-helix repeat-containing protein n=1 Tax=Luteolibacter ambystomatis TaxID=2824561 RepID=A0A975PGW7_9BACT|nr:right-handed parallel beta-helix repeat-containing protein [Luteolibacter ambystomatis]QUE53154.1 right-handed parallel beta-helix repeat-containing protein [Luteolibacter ambystomatis]